MDALEHWKLCDSLTVVEAALLAVNVDAKYAHQVNRLSDRDCPEHYTVYVLAIGRALQSGLIEGSASYHESYESAFDPEHSTVDVKSVSEWLSNKGIENNFFSTKDARAPDYLDIEHPQYSAKLAAAVNAWLAIANSPDILNNAQTPKQNAVNWLTAHAAQYGLVKANGEINQNAIEDQIAKIVNWQETGGAPATPSAQPATPSKPLINKGWLPPNEQPTPQVKWGNSEDMPF